MQKVVVVGSINVDLVFRTRRLPRMGESVRGENFRIISGGKGSNQAVAIARMGTPVSLVASVGDDEFGKAQINHLQSEGIDTSAIRFSPDKATGVAVIAIDELGENGTVYIAGANENLTKGHLIDCEQFFAEAQILVCQLENYPEVIKTALAIAKHHNLTIVLDPTPPQAIPASILDSVDYLILNESEAAMLSGIGIGNNIESAMLIADSLAGQVGKAVVITRGDQGAIMNSGGKTIQFPGYRVQVVDTTAAGDAFIGGFVGALARNLPLETAVQQANAAGAISVTRFGAQHSLPTIQEVEQFLASQA